MAALAAIPFRLDFVPNVGGGSIIPSLSGLLQEFIYINLILMIFNLIPLPPLDGSKILRALAPRSWDSILAPLEQYGPFLLMILVFLGGRMLGVLVGQPALALFRALVG
jgi:Zn-dependent protease